MIFFSFMPLPVVFARCVGPCSLCWCRDSVFVVVFFFSTRQQRLPPGVQFSVQRLMSVSVLSSSVQGMAELFSCRVKCCIQISVLRTIFCVSALVYRGKAQQFSCRVKFNVRLPLLFDFFQFYASASCLRPLCRAVFPLLVS